MSLHDAMHKSPYLQRSAQDTSKKHGQTKMQQYIHETRQNDKNAVWTLNGGELPRELHGQ